MRKSFGPRVRHQALSVERGAGQKNELFFNAMDSQNNLLQPGRYEYRLTVRDKGAATTGHASFNHVKN